MELAFSNKEQLVSHTAICPLHLKWNWPSRQVHCQGNNSPQKLQKIRSVAAFLGKVDVYIHSASKQYLPAFAGPSHRGYRFVRGENCWVSDRESSDKCPPEGGNIQFFAFTSLTKTKITRQTTQQVPCGPAPNFFPLVHQLTTGHASAQRDSTFTLLKISLAYIQIYFKYKHLLRLNLLGESRGVEVLCHDLSDGTLLGEELQASN